MRKTAPALLLAVGLAGCAASATPQRGIFLSSGGVEAFQPCGTTSWFLVTGKNAVLDPVRNQSLALSTALRRPPQPFYVEAVASVKPKDKDTPAPYEGTYRFDEVTTIGQSVAARCNAVG